MSSRHSNQENSSTYESNRSRRQQPTPSSQHEPLNSTSPSHSDQASKACCFCWCCCCSCSWYVDYISILVRDLFPNFCTSLRFFFFCSNPIALSISFELVYLCVNVVLSCFRRGSPHHRTFTDSSSSITFIYIQILVPYSFVSPPGEFAR